MVGVGSRMKCRRWGIERGGNCLSRQTWLVARQSLKLFLRLLKPGEIVVTWLIWHHMSDILSPLPDQAFAAIAAHSRYHCRFARLRRPRATTQPVAGRFLSAFRGHIAPINMTSSHKWRLVETTLLVLTSLSSQHTYEQVYRF